MSKRYYVKYNVAIGELILDSSKVKSNPEELLVVPHMIGSRQGKVLKERITNRFLYKRRKPFLQEIEHEFYKIFHVCKTCGHVTNKQGEHKHQKRWGDECKKCYQKTRIRRRKEWEATKDHRKVIRRYKLHLNTLQGQIDAVPIEVIESNVRLEMKLQGKTPKEMAQFMGVSQSRFSEMFRTVSIKKDYLLKMSEYLFVPVEKLIRRPRGVRIPYVDGVPKFWLDKNFRIRNYETSP